MEAVHLARSLVHPDVDAVLRAAVGLCLARVLLGDEVGDVADHFLHAAAPHPHHASVYAGPQDIRGGNDENGDK